MIDDIVKLRFRKKEKIIWECPSNSNINKTVGYSENKDLLILNSAHIPRIGETVTYKDKTYDVLSVNYNMSDIENPEVEIQLSSTIYEVDYYDYMQAFTHTYDYMKEKNDCSKVPDYNAYTSVLPSSSEEWLEDIQIMKVMHTNEERASLANRRCKRE